VKVRDRCTLEKGVRNTAVHEEQMVGLLGVVGTSSKKRGRPLPGG